jgi:hypothetical protein
MMADQLVVSKVVRKVAPWAAMRVVWRVVLWAAVMVAERVAPSAEQ